MNIAPNFRKSYCTEDFFLIAISKNKIKRLVAPSGIALPTKTFRFRNRSMVSGCQSCRKSYMVSAVAGVCTAHAAAAAGKLPANR